MSSKLRRQYCASKYIEYLEAGTIIINVDESVISRTINCTRSWLPRGRHFFVASSNWLPMVNIIAGVSSNGGLFYTVNRGKTNSWTFLNYIVKLVAHLDIIDPDWRKNTIIMIDNASYHRSIFTKAKLEILKVPIMYMGPYHFRLAPAELFFSFIKGKDLNPFNSRVVSK